MQAFRGVVCCMSGVLGLAGVLMHGDAMAQVVPPKPLGIEQPDPPTNRFGMAHEGWVVVRYAVRADGTTDDVTFVDKMPTMLEHRVAVAAVESWTFEPATADGSPIDWHNNEAVIVFDVEEVPPQPSAGFIVAWQEAQGELDEGKPDKALRSNRNMQPMRLAEIGLAQMQQASINLTLGNTHAALAAISRVTESDIPALSSADLAAALQYRNALELQIGDVMAALETFERRQAMNAVADGDPVAAALPAVERALSEGATIAISGLILDDVWRHALDRRTFAIGEVDGDIDTITVECNRRTAELEYSEDAEWSLPESWGACSVAVEGRDDTAFKFFEFQ